MFYMDTLKYLKKGGRIGKVTSVVGEVLNLKPIISCNEDGIYYTVGLIRGAKQGKKKLLNEMLQFCRDTTAGSSSDTARPTRRPGGCSSSLRHS